MDPTTSTATKRSAKKRERKERKTRKAPTNKLEGKHSSSNGQKKVGDPPTPVGSGQKGKRKSKVGAQELASAISLTSKENKVFLASFKKEEKKVYANYVKLAKTEGRYKEFKTSPVAFILTNEPACCLDFALRFICKKMRENIKGTEVKSAVENMDICEAEEDEEDDTMSEEQIPAHVQEGDILITSDDVAKYMVIKHNRGKARNSKLRFIIRVKENSRKPAVLREGFDTILKLTGVLFWAHFGTDKKMHRGPGEGRFGYDLSPVSGDALRSVVELTQTHADAEAFMDNVASDLTVKPLFRDQSEPKRNNVYLDYKVREQYPKDKTGPPKYIVPPIQEFKHFEIVTGVKGKESTECNVPFRHIKTLLSERMPIPFEAYYVLEQGWCDHANKLIHIRLTLDTLRLYPDREVPTRDREEKKIRKRKYDEF